MKKQKINYLVSIVLIAAICTVTACKKQKATCKYNEDIISGASYLPAYIAGCSEVAYFEVPPTNPANGKSFNYTKFENAIRDSLIGYGGYQIAVLQGSFPMFVKSAGMAREAKECPKLELGNCNKMNIASVTKMMTAATTLKLLDLQGLDETATVGQFLPTSWNVPAGMANLTFQQMLSHRTGLHQYTKNSDFSNTLSYEGLRTLAKTGPNPDSISFRFYRNANVAMMRIIIPALWKNVAGCPAELQSAGEITDALSQKYYEQAVRQFVLTPVGATGELDAGTLDDFQTLYYSSNGSKGYSSGNWKGITGGGGWNMSAVDMARVADGIFDGSIVSSTIATNMINKVMGVWNYLPVTDGTLVGHGGDISGSEGEWHNVLLYNQNNRLSIAININSRTVEGGGLYNIIVRAYNLAWE
jgi:CubicO group peptidase (beta-lactamase class C family)